MPLDIIRTRKLLADFDFKPLFIEELGWNRHEARLEIHVDLPAAQAESAAQAGGRTFTLSAVAEKCGMVVFVCDSGTGVSPVIPDDQTRRKIERQVAKSAYEHLIVFLDPAKSRQYWLWSRRETGRQPVLRGEWYRRGETGERLAQKIRRLAVALEEEENLTLPDVTCRARKAFDVARVTKKFYDRFKTEHAAFLKFLEGIPDLPDRQAGGEMERWYVSVMLNRLMFIYFIQKKGFLGEDPDYLKNKLAQSRRELGKDRYYHDFLCPLFFEGFAKQKSERSEKARKLLGDVPYLNGGIFLPHQIEQLHGKTIAIPDKAFEKLFEFFDAYHWHLDERPLKADNEINPDVLGYIFEKYINQKQMGAYYTKEDITGYIGQNTVIPFLFDAAREKCKVAFDGGTGVSPVGSVWRLLQEDPDRYIYQAVKHCADKPLPPEIAGGLDAKKPNLLERRKGWNKAAPPEYAMPTEIWREVVARRKRCEEVKRFLEGGAGVPPVDSQLHPFSPFLPVDVAQRNLPHWQQAGAAYFVTFRLADSLPTARMNQWRREKESWLKANPEPWSEQQQAEFSKQFPRRLNEWLDAGEGGCFLSQPALSEIVEKALRHFDGERYALDQFVIMPNHVHVLLAPMAQHGLPDILHSWKSFTAHEINKRLDRAGTVWQDESFDHIVRSEEQLQFYRDYINENPKKAKLKAEGYRVGTGNGVSLMPGNTGQRPVPHSFSINDLITYNLDIRRFAQDVIENAEGPELLVAFWKAIEAVTVLDPTCGSGAFLFATLNILEPLYEACLERMRFFLEEWESSTGVPPVDGKNSPHRPEACATFRKNHPNYHKLFTETLKRVEERLPDEALAKAGPNRPACAAGAAGRRYFVLKSAIVNNLFGVDIMEEAVEICKLRLFLKLVAQIERVEDIEPLPDIDFNIRAGNTLVGFAKLSEVRDAAENEIKQDAVGLRQGRLFLGDTEAQIQRIEEEAEIADRAFRKFREMQTEQGMKPADFAEAKENLRSRLRKLTDELDRFLAGQYGVDCSTGVPPVKESTGQRPVPLSPAFEKWRKSHKPFHWFAEFYGILKAGGFDVIIGNPPYVEYGKVKKEYTVRGYDTEECGNLYAFILERNASLVRKRGRTGMIVPHSAICTDRMDHVQGLLTGTSVTTWVSTYCIRPAKLFVGVDQRLAIYVSLHGAVSVETFASRYHRWHEEFRPYLLTLIQYANTAATRFPNSVPKIHSISELALLARIALLKPLKKALANHAGSTVYFHNAPRYWVRAMDFAPYFWNERGEQISTHVKTLLLPNKADASVVVGALNSSLFYWWFILLSSCRDLTMREIDSFPLGLDRMPEAVKSRLAELTRDLMADFKRHRVRKECQYQATGKVVYDEFYPKHSKPIIDEIDKVLAQHYGFTDEELDFIINYDIKYRMGAADDDKEDT